MIVSMLANLAADATLCPSEVARALVVENKSEEWRTAMPVVHAAADALLHSGSVKLSWKVSLSRLALDRIVSYRIWQWGT